HRAYVPGDLRFCFRAEDGIRDRNVTGVQTCALPISLYSSISIVISPRLLRKNTALHLTSSTGSKWRDEHAVRRIFCCSPGGSAVMSPGSFSLHITATETAPFRFPLSFHLGASPRLQSWICSSSFRISGSASQAIT